jgi:hypothetical protein
MGEWVIYAILLALSAASPTRGFDRSSCDVRSHRLGSGHIRSTTNLVGPDPPRHLAPACRQANTAPTSQQTGQAISNRSVLGIAEWLTLNHADHAWHSRMARDRAYWESSATKVLQAPSRQNRATVAGGRQADDRGTAEQAVVTSRTRPRRLCPGYLGPNVSSVRGGGAVFEAVDDRRRLVLVLGDAGPAVDDRPVVARAHPSALQQVTLRMEDEKEGRSLWDGPRPTFSAGSLAGRPPLTLSSVAPFGQAPNFRGRDHKRARGDGESAMAATRPGLTT